jgi:hypothetical protein
MGSLHDLLHNESIDDIPIKMGLKLLKQAAKGLYFLHSSGNCVPCVCRVRSCRVAFHVTLPHYRDRASGP